MRLESARLVVRTFEPRDGAEWVEMINDPEVRRFLPPCPDATLDTFSGVLERRRQLEREHGYAM